MKIKNIEHVWSELKGKLPSYVHISTIEDIGLKTFDVTIPKSRVIKFPTSKKQDLEFNVTWDDGLVIFFETINDTEYPNTIEEVLTYINQYITKMNESVIIDTEPNKEFKGLDYLITFDNKGISRKDIESKLSKSGKKYFLEVYPTSEAGLYVAKKDLEFFKGYLEVLTESVEGDASGSVVGVGLIQHIDKDFVSTLSDDGLRNAIKQIETSMTVPNQGSDNAKVFHREAEDRLQLIKDEFAKRGIILE